MSLFTPRRIAAGSAIVVVGFLGATSVAFAQAGSDVSTNPRPTSSSTPVSTPSPSATHTDDPATHDVGDDHGIDDHGNDDPATHDVNDDHGGDRDGADDRAGHGNSGHSGKDDDQGDNGGHGSDD